LPAEDRSFGRISAPTNPGEGLKWPAGAPKRPLGRALGEAGKNREAKNLTPVRNPGLYPLRTRAGAKKGPWALRTIPTGGLEDAFLHDPVFPGGRPGMRPRGG
jgi:hypothetical protein